jgi:glucose-induced degradation protein 4
MPLVHTVAAATPIAQSKHCSVCHSLLDVRAPDPSLCGPCLHRSFVPDDNSHAAPESRPLCTDIDSDGPRQPSHDPASHPLATRRPLIDSPSPSPSPAIPVPLSFDRQFYQSSQLFTSSYPQKHPAQHDLSFPSSFPSLSSSVSRSHLLHPPEAAAPPHPPPASPPSPLTDITRIRIRSQGYHCLYPGSTFRGTQKSGRNSYDVNVTIVVSISYC